MWTSESASQTNDYARIVHHAFIERERSYLFLSPKGAAAADPRFKSIAYWDLFNLLAEISDGHDELLEHYLDELEQIFIAPRRDRILMTRKILGQA